MLAPIDKFNNSNYEVISRERDIPVYLHFFRPTVVESAG